MPMKLLVVRLIEEQDRDTRGVKGLHVVRIILPSELTAYPPGRASCVDRRAGLSVRPAHNSCEFKSEHLSRATFSHLG